MNTVSTVSILKEPSCELPNIQKCVFRNFMNLYQLLRYFNLVWGMQRGYAWLIWRDMRRSVKMLKYWCWTCLKRLVEILKIASHWRSFELGTVQVQERGVTTIPLASIWQIIDTMLSTSSVGLICHMLPFVNLWKVQCYIHHPILWVNVFVVLN